MKVVGIVGSSGSGKTTLITEILPLLRERGLRVSTVKHAHHGFDMDRPGKDSYLHRAAGAEEVMVVSGGRWALLREHDGESEIELSDLLNRMTQVDLVLVEGFKRMNLPKIEVYRPCTGKPPLYPHDPDIKAVASDEVAQIDPRRFLALESPATVADFVLSECMR